MEIITIPNDFDRVEPSVDLSSLIPNIKFYQVHGPTFLDHALEARCVKSERLSLETIAQISSGTSGFYVYEVYRTNKDVRENLYSIRYAIGSDKNLEIITKAELHPVVLNGDNFHPLRPIKVFVEMESVLDLKTHWGKEEVVKILGEQLFELVMTPREVINDTAPSDQ